MSVNKYLTSSIPKLHLMILLKNTAGRKFWSELGWQYRQDNVVYTFINGNGENT